MAMAMAMALAMAMAMATGSTLHLVCATSQSKAEPLQSTSLAYATNQGKI